MKLRMKALLSKQILGFSLMTTSFIEKSNLFEQMYNSLGILVW